MMYSSPPRLDGTRFTETEKTTCLDSGGILRATLEFGPACNLNCAYCYASDQTQTSFFITEHDCCRIIHQVAEAGARSIVVIGGGEPLLYPYWKRIVLRIREKGMTPILFTNGQLLDDTAVEVLIDAEASVILKMDSPDSAIQDTLAGRSGAAEAISAAASRLLAQGFAESPRHRFAIHAVICPLNIDTLPELWRWARQHNIIPMFQLVTWQGRGAETSLHLNSEQAHNLFSALLEIDEREFGFTWPIQPPYVGDTCEKFLYNVYINYSGEVSPCVGVPLPIGSISEQSVIEILHSPKMLQYRSIMQNLHGECATCERAGKCYGCRGTAFSQAGDPFATDPSCWMNNDRNG